MAEPRTGAERYLAGRLEDPEYRRTYELARQRIDQIDTVIQVLDERRTELKLSKAELARRAGVKPEAIRRLFSSEKPNPTLSTLVALAGALDLELRPEPRTTSTTRGRSAAAGTRRRTTEVCGVTLQEGEQAVVFPAPLNSDLVLAGHVAVHGLHFPPPENDGGGASVTAASTACTSAATLTGTLSRMAIAHATGDL